MWSTLTAGLQLVQQKLDHVIDVAGQHPDSVRQKVVRFELVEGGKGMSLVHWAIPLVKPPMTSPHQKVGIPHT